MINEHSLAAVEAARRPDGSLRPLYGSYCFAGIPQTIRALLGAADAPGLPADVLGALPRRYDKVVLFFLDAFGWQFFARHAAHPFLQRFAREGVVSKLTAQFPSTTAAHVTAIHTGLPVGASGVYEWFYYEPLLDTIIAPLLFSRAGDTERETLRASGIAPTALYPATTIYQDLQRQGVRSTIFQHRDYTPSPYSDVVFAGAQVARYRTLPEALTRLTAALLREDGPAYYFLYFDLIDTQCHAYGPDSPEVAAEIDACLTTLERLFHQPLAGRLRDTLLLVTADHGQMGIDPATTIYLNRLLPRLVETMRTDRQGRPIVPAGSCRDMFLYIRPEHLDAVQAELAQHLAGRAAVVPVADMLAEGFFGPDPPSAALLGRLGNLVILPHAGESVWWYEKGRFVQSSRGAHGGLSPEEMETMLLAQAY